MKIGILTQPLQNNYGGLLQNYALQQVLKAMGHNPITLDHKSREFPAWHRLLGHTKGVMLHILSPSKNPKPKYVPTNEELNIIEANTRNFIERSIIRTKKCLGGEDFKKEVVDRGIEALVVGSDQCWRPAYNDYLEDMYLQFAENLSVKKRMSYAASFGTDEWEYTKEMTKVCSSLAKIFDLITVREKSGITLCKERLGVDAVHVLDPTMMLAKEHYVAMIEEYGENESEGNLFNYILDPTSAKIVFVEKVAKKKDLTSFQVLPVYNEDHRTKENVKYEIEKCIYPSPVKWLRAFMDAEMTIVDSFHGMVFSIIFNKPFWVIGNLERGMSRFNSLLSDFGLSERLISEKDLSEIDFLKPIDWGGVNKILDSKRKGRFTR